MILMKWHIALLSLLTIHSRSESLESHRGDDDSYHDDDDYDNTSSYETENSFCPQGLHCFDGQLEKVLQRNQNALITLFGSVENVNTEFCSWISGDKLSYWTFDQAHYVIETALNNSDNLDPETREGIEDVLQALDNETDELCDPDCILCELDEERQIIDCALGRQGRNKHFNNVENGFVVGSWECSWSIPDLWLDLVNTDYEEKDCTLTQSIMALLEIEKEGEHYSTVDSSIDKKSYAVKLDLLLTLSNGKAMEYLKSILCKENDLLQCEIYKKALCSRLDYALVTEITHDINNATSNHQLREISDIYTLLDIQRGLGHASSNLTTRASARSSAEIDAAHDMLNYYFEMVDSAVGDSSIETWKQTSKDNVWEQFEKILLESEEFAEYASDMIFARRTRSTELDKETVGLKMKRVSSAADDNVTFDFDDAKVWTQNIRGDSSRNQFNVLALYYKTWHQTLEAVTTDNATTNFDKTEALFANGSRVFVGKGGIISLSSRTNQEKTSIPVFYRINFDRERFYDGMGVRRLCLSCGYLDGFSRLWKGNGCYVTEADDVGVTCHCNHTTNFAAFMSPYEPQYNTTETQETWLNILEYFGSGASAACLFVSFVVFCVVRHHVKHDRLRAHMNLVLALFFVHLIQLLSEAAVNNNTLCVMSAISTHYFLLAAFMWMLIEGIFLYFYVIQVFMLSKIESRHWMYLVGWFTPLIVVLISASYGLSNDVYIKPRTKEEELVCGEGQLLYPPFNESTNNLKYESCWLDTSSGMMWAFIAPALLVITLNLIILIKVLVVLAKLKKRSRQMKNFKSSTHCYPNHGYGMKAKPATQIFSPKYSLNTSQVDGMSLSDESNVTQESLHGSVVTHTSSSFYPHSKPSPRDRNSSHSPLYDASAENNFLSDVKTAVKGAFVLLPLLGITWVIGTLRYLSYALAIVFVVLNSLQGVAIFLVYCVFNEEVSRVLCRQWSVYRMNHFSSGRYRTSSSSSMKSMSNKGLLLNKRRSTEVSTISKSNMLL